MSTRQSPSVRLVLAGAALLVAGVLLVARSLGGGASSDASPASVADTGDLPRGDSTTKTMAPRLDARATNGTRSAAPTEDGRSSENPRGAATGVLAVDLRFAATGAPASRSWVHLEREDGSRDTVVSDDEGRASFEGVRAGEPVILRPGVDGHRRTGERLVWDGQSVVELLVWPPLVVEGLVRRADGRPVEGGLIRLEGVDRTHGTDAMTDEAGRYRFEELGPVAPRGLRATRRDLGSVASGVFETELQLEPLFFDLVLEPYAVVSVVVGDRSGSGGSLPGGARPVIGAHVRIELAEDELPDGFSGFRGALAGSRRSGDTRLTDADGRARFAVRRAGRYELAIGVEGLPLRDSVVVHGPGELEHEVRLAPTESFEGRVLDAFGEPLAGLSLTLSTPQSDPIKTRTASDGRFSFARVPVGARPRGTLEVSGGLTKDRAIPLVVAHREPLAGREDAGSGELALSLPRPTRIEGSLVSRMTRLRFDLRRGRWLGSLKVPSEERRFAFDVICSEPRVDVLADLAEESPAWVGVPMVPGTTVELDDFQGQPARLAGRLLEASGEPASGVRVSISTGMSWQRDTTTGADGRFAFDGVPSGLGRLTYTRGLDERLVEHVIEDLASAGTELEYRVASARLLVRLASSEAAVTGCWIRPRASLASSDLHSAQSIEGASLSVDHAVELELSPGDYRAYLRAPGALDWELGPHFTLAPGETRELTIP